MDQYKNDARVQGFSQAKLAWKKKNAIPTTNKEAKAQRPNGRGDGGARGGRAAPNRGGGRAPVGESEDQTLLHQQKRLPCPCRQFSCPDMIPTSNPK